MSKLDQIVYVIDNGQINESRIRDMSGYVDETTTPHGVAPRLHVRGTELWTWGHAGNFPRQIAAFDTEAEAEAALEDHHAADFWNCPDICAFKTREDAQKFLSDSLQT